jgi:glycosyltransferase involved in cell wall biosynthesis
MALAFQLCLLRRVLGFVLVIDRHSNFKFNLTAGLKWRLFQWVSRFTVRHADLTIVTNKQLREVVEAWGGCSFVLQDKLPDLPLARRIELPGEKNIVVISTFADDEPISEVLDAAAMLPARFVVHITGNSKGYPRQEQLAVLPRNVRLTSFLPEADYQSLLISADVIVVLTCQDHTLTCGAYESVALGRPSVLSDTVAIREYFAAGAVYTLPTAEGIREAIMEALLRESILEIEVAELRGRLVEAWERRFEELQRKILALLMTGR